MTELKFAYLAGAMDSDGYFTIKKSTYHMRVRKDANNPVYSEKVGLHQALPDIPYLLQETFGGTCYLAPSQTENSRPMYRYGATDKIAASLCQHLLPYLIIKKRQAKILLELRESKSKGYKQVSYWFEKEFPDWQNMELITMNEVVDILGYTSKVMVTQAISNKSLLAIPYDNSGIGKPRIPKLLVERFAENAHFSSEKGRIPARELIEWRESLWNQVIKLNKRGINGTPVNHRTGYYSPK